MPFVPGLGIRADIVCNGLGVINRLNPGQLYEVELNFISDNIVHKMKTMQNLKDKRELYFDYLSIVNPTYAKRVIETYKLMTIEEKSEFIIGIEREGIYIHMPPFWNNIKLKVIEMLYTKFDWIEPYKCYIHKHGRDIPILRPLVIGDKYIIRLKHSAKGKFSARATGHVNLKNVPAKSLSVKQNKALYSKTPVRIGEQEFNNLALAMDLAIIARMYMVNSASTQARRQVTELYTGNVLNLDHLELGEAKNRNVEIFNTYLKSLGIRICYRVKGKKAIIPTQNVVKYRDPFKIITREEPRDPFVTINELRDPFVEIKETK